MEQSKNKIKDIINSSLKSKEKFSLIIKNKEFYDILKDFLEKENLIKTKYLSISIIKIFEENDDFNNENSNDLDNIIYEDNLINLTKTYGEVIKIKRKSKNNFYVEMEDKINASLVFNFLDKHIIDSLKIKIIVDFISEDDFKFIENNKESLDNLCEFKNEKIEKNDSENFSLFENFELKNRKISQCSNNVSHKNNYTFFDNFINNDNNNENDNDESITFTNNKENLIPKNNNDIENLNNINKFTCRFDIQIPNDNNFQVAKKIIGSKGYNMKNVIQLTLDELDYSFSKYGSKKDLIKLRLRGKGSGYKEGHENKESEDPLHLCLSTKNYDIYKISCKYVEKWLNKIYKEFYHFCEKKFKKNEILKIMKFEYFDSEKINFT